jgi:hypothetical protein
MDDLNIQLDENTSLKKIIEKNLEEALNSLQHEREQKHSLKKELTFPGPGLTRDLVSSFWKSASILRKAGLLCSPCPSSNS